MATKSFNDIDNIFKQRLETFEQQPSTDLWNKIDNSLDRRKRQKTFIIASLAITSIFGAVLTYSFWPSEKVEQITENREVIPVIKEIKRVEEISLEEEVVKDKSNDLVKTTDVNSIQLVASEQANPINTDVTEHSNQGESTPAIEEQISEVETDNESSLEVVATDVTTEEVEPTTDKEMAASPITDASSLLEKNDTLTLSIEFANLERRMADKITIVQTIPDFLDINSLKPVKSSHDYKMKVRKSQRKVIWTLKEVPARGTKNSKGYIDYDIVVTKSADESQLKSKEEVTYDYGYYRTKSSQ